MGIGEKAIARCSGDRGKSDCITCTYSISESKAKSCHEKTLKKVIRIEVVVRKRPRVALLATRSPGTHRALTTGEPAPGVGVVVAQGII